MKVDEGLTLVIVTGPAMIFQVLQGGSLGNVRHSADGADAALLDEGRHNQLSSIPAQPVHDGSVLDHSSIAGLYPCAML